MRGGASLTYLLYDVLEGSLGWAMDRYHGLDVVPLLRKRSGKSYRPFSRVVEF